MIGRSLILHTPHTSNYVFLVLSSCYRINQCYVIVTIQCFIYMYLVIMIMISWEEDINRSFLKLRLDLKSPELELELKIKISGIGTGTETYCKNGIDPNQCWELFLCHRLQRKPLVSDRNIHHSTCVTHVPWCMSGSLTDGGGENVPAISGECATRNFAYLVRGPLAWYRIFPVRARDGMWSNLKRCGFAKTKTVSIFRGENCESTITAVTSHERHWVWNEI